MTATTHSHVQGYAGVAARHVGDLQEPPRAYRTTRTMAREQLSWMRVAPKLTKCIFLGDSGAGSMQQLLGLYVPVPMLHDNWCECAACLTCA